MDILLLIFAVLLILAGIVGTALPLLPGTPLVFFGLWLLAHLDGYVHVGAATLWLLAFLALLAFVVDHLAAVMGVQRAGASRQAVIGAFLGGLLGFLGGLLGIIIGPVIGAMLGEWLAGRGHGQAARVGTAAGLSFIVAVALKLGIVMAMLGVFALIWWL